MSAFLRTTGESARNLQHNSISVTSQRVGWWRGVLVVEVGRPRFEEVWEAEVEVAYCDDEVGADGGVWRTLQDREQQLQILLTKLRAAIQKQEPRISCLLLAKFCHPVCH